MQTINNILVALDLSDIDETLIKYAAYLADSLQAEKVYFVHNIKKYEIIELFEDELAELNLEEMIGDELNETVAHNFKSKVEWEVLISNDPYTESLINYIVNKYEIQLTLVGNKNKVKGTGVMSGKLLHMLKCHILSVPKNIAPEITKLCIGTDFSNASRKSFVMANFLRKNVGCKVKAMHIYNVPLQFSPYLPKENLIPTIEKHIEEKSKKFIKRLKEYGDGIEFEIVPGRSSSVPENLIHQCLKEKFDMLMISDKGGNTFSSLVIGNVTDELFNEDLEFPLWVCK
ncbi:Nucleotide-binding universal stress protein, UspA family [Zhouia amylolytica]|uniref:Universal stress protein family protein n=3 Tax=Zhouia amylolytica TaxID=376730 RepID=W2UQC9_9FLAO|nr:universal stress protein family protein [Zhouia amylolytica AD3]MCQ0110715.1 universal stress protein [Zhouia amylolytica]SFT03199.1 Nucleotide-binding universal stress protein, UspA family [Zhouia amylolytica]